MILLKHGVTPKIYFDIPESLQAQLQEVSVNRLLGMFEYIVQAEQSMSKVSKKQAFLEMSLLRLSSFGQGAQQGDLVEATTPSLEIKKKSIIEQWNHVLEELKQDLDPMIFSVFKEAKLQEENGLLKMNSFTKFLFFEDVINEHRPAWMKVLKKYGDVQKVELTFDIEQTAPRPTERIVRKAIESQGASSFSTSKYKKLSSEEIKDLKITSALLSHFDGDVYNITITGKS
jgi:DNA polymerase III gamma/tau subunit